MFGLTLYEKMSEVLNTYFEFSILKEAQEVARAVTKEANQRNLNQYDAAILFIGLHIKAMPRTRENQIAAIKLAKKMETVSVYGKIGSEDAINYIKACVKRHGIRRVSPPTIPSTQSWLKVNLRAGANTGNYVADSDEDEQDYVEVPWYRDFSEWYEDFKIACGTVNRALSIDENGCSLVDFMDHTNLRNAFRNHIGPGTLAEKFAKDFDMHTFGRR